MTVTDRDRIVALERENEELRAENEYWADLIRSPKDGRRIAVELGLRPHQAHVLVLISKLGKVSNELILTCLGDVISTNYPAVVVHSLRRVLKPYDIAIFCIYGWGYEVVGQDLIALRRLLTLCKEGTLDNADHRRKSVVCGRPDLASGLSNHS